jgi:hypothetical protein
MAAIQQRVVKTGAITFAGHQHLLRAALLMLSVMELLREQVTAQLRACI